MTSALPIFITDADKCGNPLSDNTPVNICHANVRDSPLTLPISKITVICPSIHLSSMSAWMLYGYFLARMYV